jgi:hypothetical protein
MSTRTSPRPWCRTDQHSSLSTPQTWLAKVAPTRPGERARRPRNRHETLPTTEGEATQDTAHRDEGHQGRDPAGQPIRRLPKQIQRKSQRHQPHLATTTSNKPTACSPSSPARAQTTQNKQSWHTDAPPSRCEDGKWSQRINTAPRIKQSQYLVRWLPTRSKPGPSAFTEGGPSIGRNPCCRMIRHSTMGHVQICWRAASKTRRTTHRHAGVRRMRQDVRLASTTTAPLKMKQNSGDARQRPQPRTLLWCARLLGGRLGKPLRGPRYAAAIRSGTRSTKTRQECRRTRQGPHQQ